MALVNVHTDTTGTVSLVSDSTFKKPTGTAVKKRKLKVLDEDTYTEDLENIITRDFFPDIPRLEAQAEYLEALEKNDVVKLRELHTKYSSRPGTSLSSLNTPSTFETPLNNVSGSNDDNLTDGSKVDGIKDDKESKLPASLDAYLAKNTSEDNASFSVIMEEADKLHRAQHSWLYEREQLAKEKHKDILALPSAEQQALQDNPRPLEIDTWTYNNKNSLMYVPEGVAYTEEEISEMKKNQKEIVHRNTRFDKNPFNEQANRQAITEAAHIQARMKEGKIGIDGKELLPNESPKVNGYGFVATPSPAPGVNETPLMTWGEIEGTPFLLDASATPLNHTTGPSFHIADVPARDRLAIELADKARKRHKANKELALKTVQENLASPLRRTTERLSTMSPAAQRLASSRLGIRMGTDKALMASYTPSRPTKSCSSTPSITPKSVSVRTPTVPFKPSGAIDSELAASLTDNLLQIPQRSRAADFFDS